MIALIDGDIVVYRTGFASNDVSLGIAKARANETMEQILHAVGAIGFRVYLSDKNENNFRYKIFPGYKASRLTSPRPVHYQDLKDFLIHKWGAVITQGQEADDALGIDQSIDRRSKLNSCSYNELVEKTIICSIDKDLLQVPGSHYNWVRNEFYEQTWLQGLRSFYEQCLTGDRTDDVSGIRGIGKVKAGRALAGAETEAEMFEIVRGMWNDDKGLLQAGQLLWVRRKDGDLWEFPFTEHDMIQKSLSLSMKPKAIDPYSAHGTQEKSGAPEVGSSVDDITKISSVDLT